MFRVFLCLFTILSLQFCSSLILSNVRFQKLQNLLTAPIVLLNDLIIHFGIAAKHRMARTWSVWPRMGRYDPGRRSGSSGCSYDEAKFGKSPLPRVFSGLRLVLHWAGDLVSEV